MAWWKGAFHLISAWPVGMDEKLKWGIYIARYKLMIGMLKQETNGQNCIRASKRRGHGHKNTKVNIQFDDTI